MRRNRIAAFMIVATVALIASPVPAGPAGADENADVRAFGAEGTVAEDDLDPSTPLKEGFTLVDAEMPPQATGTEREDGSVPIHVTPDTKYYHYDDATGSSKAGTYESVIVPGERLKVGGQVTTVGGHRRLTARWVWAPPPPSGPKPANPQPQAVKDFTLQRTFNVVGEVLQTGSKFPTWNGLYHETFGFVGGNFVSFNNDHIERVAAAHHDKLSFTVTPETTFYLQGSDGRYRKVSQGEAITVGNPVRVAGKYAWVLDDWQLIARAVWQPMKEAARGAIEWHGAVDRRDAESSTYDGPNLAGDGEVYPGTTELQLDWVPQPTGVWAVAGSWWAGDLGGDGTIGGSIEGTWDPATGELESLAILDHGTGRHHNVTGSGTLIGRSTPQPLGTATPPDSISIDVKLAVERHQTESAGTETTETTETTEAESTG